MLKSKKLSRYPQISHGFFNRNGGVSKGIYKSLNCGIGSNDNKKNVLKNLKIVSKKLGFKKPTDNSIDSVADRDFVLDFLSAASICAMHISRFAEELIIWNSDIFKLVKINDKMLTGSSIMPQKKNPDPAELIRGRAGKNFGSLQAMLTTMKGLPLSYYKDMQLSLIHISEPTRPY